MHYLLQNSQRVVIKLGTRILGAAPDQLDEKRIQGICKQVAAYRKQGIEVIIVSSGAVALGMHILDLHRRPTALPLLQTCASVGQALLMNTWQKAFKSQEITVAQMLLTREELKQRKHREGVKNTLEAILAKGIVPIVNENDVVSAAEIKFGDNDILSALVALLSKSSLLAILSRAEGLIDKKGTKEVVPFIEMITPSVIHMAEGCEDKAAVGGMISKVEAAHLCMKEGCGVFIGSGEDPKILADLIQGKAKGTFFLPQVKDISVRKRWLAFFEQPVGVLTVDANACDTLQKKDGSLLAKGILEVEGSFSMGDCVSIHDEKGATIGRGLTNYSSDQIEGFKGLSNQELKRQYPRLRRWEVMHRDELVIF